MRRTRNKVASASWIFVFTVWYFLCSMFKNRELIEQEQKQAIINEALNTAQGREALARALVEPKDIDSGR